MYIDDKLFTVSEKAIKVNDLNTLRLIDELKINCYKCDNNKIYYNDLIYIIDKGNIFVHYV